MSTTIRLPNGQEVEIQTNDAKAAARAAKGYWQRQATSRRQAAPKPRSGWQTAGDFLGDTIDNVIPNFGDEIAAIPDAARAAVKGQPVGEAFNRGRREFRQHQAQYDKEHPALAWGSTLTGLGASLALPAGRVASGAGMAAKLLHGAAVGALYGGVAGTGEGDSLSERANNAATGALAGGALGGAMTPAAAGLVRAGRFARQAIPGADSAVRGLANVPRSVMRKARITREGDRQTQSARFMNTRMNQGHIATGFGQQGAAATPDTLMAEVQRRQALGVPALLGDVSDAMRTTTSWASRGEGPGQRMVKASLDRRKSEEAARVRGHIVNQLGPVSVDPVRQVQQYSERARQEAGPMYAEAYAQPMVLTPEMRGIIQTPAFQEAVPNAVRNIRNAQRDPEAMGFVMGRDGQLLPDQHQFLSTEGFDQVIRAMRDNAERSMEPPRFPGGRPTNTTDSVHINARAGDLRDQLVAQNGAYRDAQATYADAMGMRDAFENGQDIRSLTGPEIAAQAWGAPQANARDAWSIGARTAMAHRASEYGANYPTGDTAADISRMLGDESKRASIQAMMPDRPNAVAGLQERLEAERQGNILWKDVQGNSKTAERQQSDKDMDQALGTMEIPSMTPTGIMTKAANLMAAGVSKGIRQDVKDHVARIVTERDPQRLQTLINEVTAVAERDRNFADRLHRAGLLPTKVGAMNSEAPEPGQFSSNPDFYRPDEDGGY
jgi:hypothetical protein